ncbi:hypothetical protein R6Q59_022781, partial [Mikania micrantha]
VNGHRTRFHMKKTTWGFDKLISTESFMESENGYLFNDSCVFGAEIFEVPQFTRLDRCLLMTKPLPTMNTFTWTIKIFSSLTEEKLRSDAFKIGKVKWNLSLYPKGSGLGKEAGMFISRRKHEPAHYMLKIESFSLLYEAATSKIESDVFETSGHKWRLDIHPNKGGHISLHVVICDTAGSDSKGWEVSVDICMFNEYFALLRFPGTQIIGFCNSVGWGLYNFNAVA